MRGLAHDDVDCLLFGSTLPAEACVLCRSSCRLWPRTSSRSCCATWTTGSAAAAGLLRSRCAHAIRHNPSVLNNDSQMLTLISMCLSLLNVKSLLCKSCLVKLVRSTAHGLPGMQAHPIFAGIGWDALAGASAPYVPTVTHELDTKNFEEFEVKEPASESMSARRRLRADPNFIGYTYKNWEAVSPRDGESCLSAPCSLAACSVSRSDVVGDTCTILSAHRKVQIASLDFRRQLDPKLAHSDPGHLHQPLRSCTAVATL